MASKEYYELLKVGLTDGETKVYLALSEIGSSTVGPIVKKSGIAYSNIYDVLYSYYCIIISILERSGLLIISLISRVDISLLYTLY